MNRMYKSFFAALLCVHIGAQAAPSHVLTFFFQKYPTWKPEVKSTLNKGLNLFNTDFAKGIFVTYFGYKTASDLNGQIVFPLKHQKPNFSLLVCQDPTPVFMLQNTISHWEVELGTKAIFYNVERQQDEKTELYFWSVEEKKIPKDRVIPLDTIIIHAHPDGIDVPTGISITSKNDQLVLPFVYVKPTVQTTKDALAFLQVSDFFGPIDRVFKVNSK